MKKFEFTGLIKLTLIFLVVSTWFVTVSWSDTTAQGPSPDRPKPPPDVPGAPPGRTQPPQSGGSSGGGGGSKGGADHDRESSPRGPCSTVYGVGVNWGHGNQPKLPITLNGPSWQTLKITDDNGHYASDCLGLGLALLNPISPASLRPLTSDVAIRLGYRQSFEVNLGLYGDNITPLPEVQPMMSVTPDQALPGEIVTYTIQVANPANLPAGAPRTMGAVMVTNLLPETVIPVSARSSSGVIEWWGNLLTVDIGELPPGETVTIVVTARLRDELSPPVIISNKASLLYTGHVAVQTPAVDVVVKMFPAFTTTQAGQ